MAQPEPKQKTGSDDTFFSRHKSTIAITAAIVFGTAAAFTAVFFTAGTTLPFIVATAAKVGLNLGFLNTFGTLAASAMATGLLSGAFAAIGTGIYALVKGFSALKNCFSSKKTDEENEAPAKKSGEENAPEVEGSTKGINAGLGGAQQQRKAAEQGEEKPKQEKAAGEQATATAAEQATDEEKHPEEGSTAPSLS